MQLGPYNDSVDSKCQRYGEWGQGCIAQASPKEGKCGGFSNSRISAGRRDWSCIKAVVGS